MPHQGHRHDFGRLPGLVLGIMIGLAAPGLLSACSGTSSIPAQPLPPASASEAGSEVASGTGSAAAETAGGSASGAGSVITTTAPAGTSSGPSGKASASFVPLLMLNPDGLGAVIGSASIRQLPFRSTDLTSVRTVLASTIGTPRRLENPECGQGPRTSLDVKGFTALFAGSRFVGWSDDGRTGHKLTTGDGLGVGSTLAQVRSSLGQVTITTDSLGPEFTSSGGLSGLLSGTTPSSTVTLLYAGESCFFR